MRGIRLLYLMMAVVMTAAAAVGAYASVCRAPCCLPHAAAAPSHHQGSGDDCCAKEASNKAEAALFFAEEGEKVQLLFAEEECGVRSVASCVASLRLTDEYTAAQPVSFDIHAPVAALAYQRSDFVYPAAASTPVQASHLEAALPGAPPVYLAVNSFLC